MFSGVLTIDAMVQMLARFKESSERREKSIFDCMIANLFEEYKFFPKYPDKQLKIAAILFGSLIKTELVTHLTLGIALRGVLDALRKSVDSKMFMFGTKALEQFMDRLVEWPQYCNHILQISHLRTSHTELVAVIERALARISSSQAESNGGNSILSDQQPESAQASIESMEASDTSWHCGGSTSSSQIVQQLSPFQLQQKHHDFLGDRLKPSAISLANTNPLLSNAGQSSLISAPVDSVTNPKPNTQSLQALPSQLSAAAPATVSSSPGFLRPSRSLTPAGMLRQPSYNTGFGAALNIETLVAAAERRDTPIEAPAQEVQDKILFMINNISTANIEAKAKEFTEVIKEQYYPWFAQYMVMKRASIEPNFHDLYLKFLDKVNSKTLNKEIVKATYENCKVLLRSELIKSSSEERSLLKNLGSWLGKFTIGRNQALLAKEIDPKSLIIEAYERGLMIAVIPFTSKVLEPCQSSLAYKPPNPWTMAILSLLTEIYNLPNLKMNLKFDIEVLFKNLGVDMKDVKPTSLLKDRVREVEGNPDFSSKDISVSQAPLNAEPSSTVIPASNQLELQPDVNNLSHPANHPNVLTQYASPLHHGSNTIVEDEKVGPLIILERAPSAQGLAQVTQSQSPFSLSQILAMAPMYESHININPKLNSMGSLLQIHRYTKAALDKAIKDIVLPVIQRSVTIASRTTKELVLKDYAMESDAVAISRAAHLMVGTLAGSLAHVTCKEPLRVALSNHLRNLLQALSMSGELLDQIVQLLTNDNIDLGCAVIEHIASEKAVELIDGEIGPSFAAIRKQRETAGSAYYDAGTYAQGPFSRVPEALRPKPGRLSDSQQRVYNDFVRNIWQNQSSQSSSVVPAGPSGLDASVNSSMPHVYGSGSGQLKHNLYPNSQVAPGFSAAQHLELIQEDSDRGSSQPGISSSKLGPNDGVIQPAVEISTIVPPLAPTVTVTSPELHIPETSSVSKDIGEFVQSSPRTPGAERVGTALVESSLSTGDALDKYQVLAQKLENLIAKDARETEIQGVIAEVPDIILRCLSRDEAGLAVAQKVFKSLYDNASSPILVVANLTILSAIRDVCKLVVKELTSWVIYSDDDRKFNKEITLGLIHSELLNLAEYDVHLGKLIDGGRNKAATEFAVSLVQALVIHEPGVSMSEFYYVIDALAKLAMMPGSPESLQQLIEIARNNTANATSLSGFAANEEEKSRLSRGKRVISGRVLANRDEYNVNESAATDPTGLRDQVSHLFSEWCRICELPATNDTTYSLYISQLQQSGLLNGDDMTDRFFRILTELSVAHCLAHEQVTTSVSLSLQSTQQFQHLSFVTIDAYAKLVFLVLKYLSVDQGSSKIVLLTKILSVTVRVIHKDAEEKKIFFNARPYFRLFINWILDLTSDPVLDGAHFQASVDFFCRGFPRIAASESSWI
ncbi:CCR4-NOT transcription complex subunit 1 [Iris pallida]|uniref:CCR4-NOT transcription complex subunit 1 n=1 Tax=Iris pallida TaxID=29817 RepID=A0AAX6H4T2_IRIPA|nr:CCR4-NOT transcription complex subunit 1 [Iris pallida]